MIPIDVIAEIEASPKGDSLTIMLMVIYCLACMHAKKKIKCSREIVSR